MKTRHFFPPSAFVGIFVLLPSRPAKAKERDWRTGILRCQTQDCRTFTSPQQEDPFLYSRHGRSLSLCDNHGVYLLHIPPPATSKCRRSGEENEHVQRARLILRIMHQGHVYHPNRIDIHIQRMIPAGLLEVRINHSDRRVPVNPCVLYSARIAGIFVSEVH